MSGELTSLLIHQAYHINDLQGGQTIQIIQLTLSSILGIGGIILAHWIYKRQLGIASKQIDISKNQEEIAKKQNKINMLLFRREKEEREKLDIIKLIDKIKNNKTFTDKEVDKLRESFQQKNDDINNTIKQLNDLYKDYT